MILCHLLEGSPISKQWPFFLVPLITSVMLSNIYLRGFLFDSLLICKLQTTETTSVLASAVTPETSIRSLIYGRCLMSICWMNQYVNFAIKMDHNNSLLTMLYSTGYSCPLHEKRGPAGMEMTKVALTVWFHGRGGEMGGDHCTSLGKVDGVPFATLFLRKSWS